MNLMEYRPFNSYIVIFPSCERMSKQEEFDSPSSVTLYLLTLVHCINNQTRIVFKALYHRTLRFPHTLLTVIISTLPLRFALTPNETVITRSDSHNFSKRNEIFINVKDIRRILAFLVSYLGRKSGQIRRLFIPPRPHSHPAYITLTLHCKSVQHTRGCRIDIEILQIRI